MKFSGKLQKIQLKSNNICYGPIPASNEEVEQRLTILSDGRVWLSRYRFGDGVEHELIKKEIFKISSEAVSAIMQAVSDYFSDEHKSDFVTDVGIWDLVLTNTEGFAFSMTGSLYYDDTNAVHSRISDTIRSKMKRNDLFVFDGNHTNRIE